MFVKICGTTSEEDALLSIALGADAVGFIFAPSKRQITASAVSDIIKRLPVDEVLTVGVFRDETPQRVVEQVLQSGVRAVQLHGSESKEDVEYIRSKLPLTIIKVLPAGSRDVKRSHKLGVDIVMLDAPNPGSGQVFDWNLASEVPDSVKLIIAGGLNPTNVVDVIEKVQPFGVDVASGVESAPGRKDPRKLREFIKNAKTAHESIAARKADALREVEREAEVVAITTEDVPPTRKESVLYDWQLEGDDE